MSSSNYDDPKIKVLKEDILQLKKEYELLSQQARNSLSSVEQIRLENQANTIYKDLKSKEEKLDKLISSLSSIKKVALVVGINSYPSGKTNLVNPAKDAETIAQLLETNGDFLVHRLPSTEIDGRTQIDPNKPVSFEELEKAIIDLFTTNNGSDTALLYFAGYGSFESLLNNNRTFLAHSFSNTQEKGIFLRDLWDLMEGSSILHQIIWLDCCHTDNSLDFGEIKRKSEEKDRSIITACYQQDSFLSSAIVEGLEPNKIFEGNWLDDRHLTSFINKNYKSLGIEAITSTQGINLIKGCKELPKKKDIPHPIKEPIIFCPYRGLFAFREKDSEYFFGREEFTKDLVNAVNKQQIVAVIGASGSGKSSVVFAGLIPQLRWQSGWLIESFRPTGEPFYNLATKLIPLLETNLSETDKLSEIKKLSNRLRKGEINLFEVIDRILSKQEIENVKLLLVIDQFEELYTQCRDNSIRTKFLDSLLETIDRVSNFTLVLTLRADFLGYALSTHLPFANALKNADLKLLPMSRQELTNVIEKPASILGVGFEPGLIERILKDVEKSPGNLPLLEFALEQLWAKQNNGELTHNGYEEIGRVEKALAEYAENIYEQLEQEDKEKAQKVFIQLVSPGEGTEDTRRIATFLELREENWNLVRKLADARLIVTGSQHENNSESVEIVHEALIREWKVLRTWMEENREFRVWQERLKIRITEWEDNRDEGSLLTGVSLGLAIEWLDKRQGELSDRQISFIEISSQRHDRLEKERRSQELEKLETEARLNTETERNQILEKTNQEVNNKLDETSNKLREADHKLDEADHKLREADHKLDEADSTINKANKKIKFGSIFLAVSVIGLIITGIGVWIAEQNRQMALLITRLEQSSRKTLNLFESGGGVEIDLLVEAMDTGQELYKLVKDNNFSLKEYPTIAPLSNLKTILDDTQERNQLQGHKDNVSDMEISQDSSFIVTTSDDNTAKIWDRNGNLLARLSGHTDNVEDVEISSDGRFIVTASIDNTAKIWDRDGNLLSTLEGHTSSLSDMEISPDGDFIVTASGDGTAKIWDRDGNLLSTLEGHTSFVSDVEISSNGSFIVTASGDGTAKIWDRDGNLLSTLEGHTSSVEDVEISSDGSFIVTTSRDGTAKIWDRDGNLLSTLEGHTSIVLDVEISSDGSFIVTASGDGTAKIWDRDGNLLSTLEGHTHWLMDVEISSDGDFIVTASIDNTAKIWDRDGNLLSTLEGHTSTVSDVEISPDGDFIVTASGDGTAKIWNKDSNLLPTLSHHTNDVLGVEISLDGNLIISGSADNTAGIWDKDGNLLSSLEGHTSFVSDVEISLDGDFIVTASWDNTAGIWDKGGNLLSTLEGHTHWLMDVEISPDGSFIVTGSRDGTAKIWDRDGNLLATLEGHTDFVMDVEISPNGSFIVTVSRDGTAKIWDRDGNLLATLEGHTDFVMDVEISPDGNFIITGSDDNTAKIWDRDGNLLATLEGHTHWLMDVETSPDGSFIVTGSADNTAKIWDRDGNLLATLEGHTDNVEDIEISSDGSFIITGSDDNTAKIWDRDGNLLATLEGHTDDVEDVEISPDGNFIITGSGDNTAKIWNREGIDQLLGRGCSWLSDYLAINPQLKERLWICRNESILIIAAEYALAEGKRLKKLGSIKAAVASFANAKLFHPTLEFEPEMEKQIADHISLISLRRGKNFAINGNIKEAIKQFNLAKKYDPNKDFDPETKAKVLAALEKGEKLAIDDLIEDAIEQFNLAKKYDPNQDFDPEIKAKLLATPAILKKGENLAKNDLIEDAILQFNKALEYDPNQDFDPQTKAKLLAVPTILEKGNLFIEQGKIEDAISAYQQAQEYDRQLQIDANSWNDLCWLGSLHGYADKVLESCDKAVILEPTDGDIKDSRGLARALTGDIKGAIEDFEAFLEWDEGIFWDDAKEKRKQWLEELKAGKNPFTPEVLKELLNE